MKVFSIVLFECHAWRRELWEVQFYHLRRRFSRCKSWIIRWRYCWGHEPMFVLRQSGRWSRISPCRLSLWAAIYVASQAPNRENASACGMGREPHLLQLLEGQGVAMAVVNMSPETLKVHHLVASRAQTLCCSDAIHVFNGYFLTFRDEFHNQTELGKNKYKYKYKQNMEWKLSNT